MSDRDFNVKCCVCGEVLGRVGSEDENPKATGYFLQWQHLEKLVKLIRVELDGIVVYTRESREQQEERAISNIHRLLEKEGY